MACNNFTRLLKPQIFTAKILSMVSYGDKIQCNGVHYFVSVITDIPLAHNINYINVQQNVKKNIYIYTYIHYSLFILIH
jgi:hypothetical protein